MKRSERSEIPMGPVPAPELTGFSDSPLPTWQLKRLSMFLYVFTHDALVSFGNYVVGRPPVPIDYIDYLLERRKSEDTKE